MPSSVAAPSRAPRPSAWARQGFSGSWVPELRSPLRPPATLAPAFYATPWQPPTTEAVVATTSPNMAWPAPSPTSASLAPPEIGDAVTVWNLVGPTPEAAVPVFPDEPAPDIGDPERARKTASRELML